MEYLTPTHQEILDVLRQANVAVIVNNHKVCHKGKSDGYAMTWRDSDNKLGRNALLMCNNTIKKNYNDGLVNLIELSHMNRSM